eukprot:1420802-Pleurochrysis_carterae.AAC.1
MDRHADRLLVYLAQTASQSVNFRAHATDSSTQSLVGYSDSDWAVSHSTTGYCILLAGAAI